jgi:hypothetical protein
MDDRVLMREVYSPCNLSDQDQSFTLAEPTVVDISVKRQAINEFHRKERIATMDIAVINAGNVRMLQARGKFNLSDKSFTRTR